jgi:hypothetical protein
VSKKTPDTVVQDIYSTIENVINGTSHDLSSDRLATLGAHVSIAVERAFQARNTPRKEKTLYMSEVGKPCARQLWYDHHGYSKIQFRPENIIKFLYGDILEALVLALAEFAGHEVSHEQAPILLNLKNGWTVRGRMDAKIDGEITDVKSASSYSFRKFEDGTLHMKDDFGYISQLEGYVHGSTTDDSYRETASFLAIDKTLGKLARTPYEFTSVDRKQFFDRLNNLVDILESETPPERHFPDKEQGKSGNRQLDTACSYCAFKEECWKDSNGGQGLRTFIYSTGPAFLTEVKRVPKCIEITNGS